MEKKNNTVRGGEKKLKIKTQVAAIVENSKRRDFFIFYFLNLTPCKTYFVIEFRLL